MRNNLPHVFFQNSLNTCGLLFNFFCIFFYSEKLSIKMCDFKKSHMGASPAANLNHRDDLLSILYGYLLKVKWTAS